MTEKFTSEKVLAMADMLDEVRIESQPRRDMQSDKIAAMLRSLLSERTAAAGDDVIDLEPLVSAFAGEGIESDGETYFLSENDRWVLLNFVNSDEVYRYLQAAQPVASVAKNTSFEVGNIFKCGDRDTAKVTRIIDGAYHVEIMHHNTCETHLDTWPFKLAHRIAAKWNAPTTPTEGGENG